MHAEFAEISHVLSPTDPFTPVSSSTNWALWLEAWKSTDNLMGRLGLLEHGFDFEDHTPFLHERLAFYMRLADVSALRKNNTGTIPINQGHDAKPGTATDYFDCMYLLSQMAFSMLCEKVFRIDPLRELGDQLYGWFNTLPRLKMCLWFFRTVQSDEANYDIGNILYRRPLPEDQKNIIHVFLGHLACVPKMCDVTEEVKYFSKNNPRYFLELLHHTGRLMDLVNVNPPVPIDEKAAEELKQLALRCPIWMPKAGGAREFRRPNSLTEALAGGSAEAIVLKILETRDQLIKSERR